MNNDIQQIALQTCVLLHTLWTAVDAKARSEADSQLQALQESDLGWDVSCLLAACRSSPLPSADLPALRFAGAQILRKKLGDHYEKQLRSDPVRKQRVWNFLVSALKSSDIEQDDLAPAVRGKLCEGAAELIVRDLLEQQRNGERRTDFLQDLMALCTGPSIWAVCEVIGLLPGPLQQMVSEVGSPFRGSRWHSSPEANSCLSQLFPVIDECLAQAMKTMLVHADRSSMEASLYKTLHSWILAVGQAFLSHCPATTATLTEVLRASLTSPRQPPYYYELLEQLLTTIPSLSETHQVLDLSRGQSAEQLLQQSGKAIDALALQCIMSVSFYSRQVVANFANRYDTLTQTFAKTYNHFPEAVLLPSLDDERHTCAIGSLLGRFCSSQMGFACIGLLDQTSNQQFGNEALCALQALMCTTPQVFNIVNLALVDLVEALRLFKETTAPTESRSFDYLMKQITEKLLERWWTCAVLILHRDNFYSHYTHEILTLSLCEVDVQEYPDFDDAMRDRQQIFDTAEDLPGIIVQTQRMRGDLASLTAMLEAMVGSLEGVTNGKYGSSRGGSLEVLIKLSEIFLEVLLSVMRSMSMEGAILPWHGSMPQKLMRAVLNVWSYFKAKACCDMIVSESAFSFLVAALLQADDALSADDWQMAMHEVCEHLHHDVLAASRCIQVLCDLHPDYFLGNERGSIVESTAASTLAALMSTEIVANNVLVTATLNAAFLQGIRTATIAFEGMDVCTNLVNRAISPLLTLAQTDASFAGNAIPTLPGERLAGLVGSLLVLFQQTSLVIAQMKTEAALSYWYGSVICASGENQKMPWETLLYICLHVCCVDSAETISALHNDPALRKCISVEELRAQLKYATDESESATSEISFFNSSYITLVRLAFAVMSDFMTILLSRKIPEAELQKQIFNDTFIALKDACATGRVSAVQGGPCALLAHMLRISLPGLRLPALGFLSGRPMADLTNRMASWQRCDLVLPMWQLHLMVVTFTGRKGYRKFVSEWPDMKHALHRASAFALQSCDGLLVSAALKVTSTWLESLTEEWQETLLMVMDFMVFWPGRVLGDLLHLLERCVFNDEKNLQEFLKLLNDHWNDPASVVVIGDVSSLPAMINADHRRLVLRCIQTFRGVRLRQLFDDLGKLCHHTAHSDIFVSYEILLATSPTTAAPSHIIEDVG